MDAQLHQAGVEGVTIWRRLAQHFGLLICPNRPRTPHRMDPSSVDLLILDDFGLVPLPPQSVEDLDDLIRERYESKSIILTSNRAPEEWHEVFNNPLLASAALDRLTHHAHIGRSGVAQSGRLLLAQSWGTIDSARIRGEEL